MFLSCANLHISWKIIVLIQSDCTIFSVTISLEGLNHFDSLHT